MPARPIDPRLLDSRRRFGRRLRHWRQAAGRTQAELGRMLMYDPSYISRVESGERWPPRQVAQRCDELLGAGRELVELWSVADHERRRPSTAAVDTAAADTGRSWERLVERRPRRLRAWIAAASPPPLRRLMDRRAERTA
jgi:transcriptional regulator with XRE-family HTH domain